MIECVPPHLKLSGLLVNPLVNTLKAGSGALVSIKYSSMFRDLTFAALDAIKNPPIDYNNLGGVPGLVAVNKKLAERLAAKKNNAGADAGVVDPKKKAAPPAKEAPKAKEPVKGKGGPTDEELAAEAEKLKLEAEEAERVRQEAIERNFDKHGELKSLGGSVIDFDTEDENRRTQHYDWLVPVFYKLAGKQDAEINVMYL